MLVSNKYLSFEGLAKQNNPKLEFKSVRKSDAVTGQYLAPKSISFGCRMLSFFSDPSKETTTETIRTDFRKELLNFADNSLRKQSTIGREFTDGVNKIHNWESLQGLRPMGNPDGWGIVGYPANSSKTTMLQEKEVDPAYASKTFDVALNRILKEPSPIVIAHVRLDGTKGYPGINNIQPFTHKNWASMINGRVAMAEAPNIVATLERYNKDYNFNPMGTVGDEKAFYYFLGKMKEHGLNIDDKNLNIKDVRRVYAEAINDINSSLAYATRALPGNIMGIVGEIETSPAFNMITSNGNVLLAYRNGPKLYVGSYDIKNGDKEYIVSSEIIQPRQDVFNKKIEWAEIPKDSILSLYKNAEGKVVKELLPLKRILQS